MRLCSVTRNTGCMRLHKSFYSLNDKKIGCFKTVAKFFFQNPFFRIMYDTFKTITFNYVYTICKVKCVLPNYIKAGYLFNYKTSYPKLLSHCKHYVMKRKH